MKLRARLPASWILVVSSFHGRSDFRQRPASARVPPLKASTPAIHQ
jgi:hypothetical protein